MTDVGVGILGPAVVVERGRTRELGATRQRALLTVLALHRGRRVPTEAIVGALWGDAPPPAAASTLQGYVADLRRVLEPRRAPRAAATVLVTEPGGYALRLDEEHVDAARFEAVVRRAGTALPRLVPGPVPGPAHPVTPDGRRPALEDWRRELDDALALWRGEPLSDLEVALEVDLERDRLRALRLDAEVLRCTALLGLGEHAATVSDLERLARQHAWDERIWVLWATALARTGRQAEALSRLRELRASLADELGLDPGPHVGELETAIVRQELAPVPTASAGQVAVSPAGGAASAPDEPRLVGRREERALLGRLLADAASGPQLLHLTGEHGQGRTRLAREAGAIADQLGFAVVESGCARAAVREPLWAWRRLAWALRAVAGGAPAGRPEPGSPVESAEEVLDLLTAATAHRPLLLVVEDVQWGDPASLVALAHVVEHLPPAPLLLLLTHRPAPAPSNGALVGLLSALGRAHAVHHALTGLAAAEVGELVADVRCGPVGRRVVEEVARRSEGNPFVVVELARHDRLLGGPLPASVRAVVAHGLRGLPDRTTELLAGASLLDPTFDAGLLADAAGLDPAEVFAALAPAVACGLLREETRYRYSFEVGVVREALAESLTPIPRARWQADLALAAARRREAADDVPLLLPAPPPGTAASRYDPPAARMYPS